MAKTFVSVFLQTPSSLPWLLSFFLLLAAALSLLFLLNRRNKAANIPPGPPRLPIVGNLYQIGKIPHLSLAKLSQKYGPVMLLQFGKVQTLVVSSPEAAKEVCKTNDLECCSRPSSYGSKRLSYNFRDFAFSPYSDYWREMRKLCVVELLTIKRVQSFWHFRDEEVANLINSLSEISPNPVKISEKIFNMMNTIICRIAFGKSYEGKQFKAGCKFEAALDEVMALSAAFWATDFFPTFGWIIDAITGRHGRLEKCFYDFDAFFERVIEEHLDPARTRPEHEDITDLLTGLSKDESNGLRLSRDHVKAILMNMFIGAIDTSSLTMVWALTELSRNPRVMQKVQAEIRSCIGRKPKVDEAELGKLTYLKMVVKETFRLHPPSTLLIPHESIRHCKIGGYNISPKTTILVNVWGTGRDPKIWKNPKEFYPERFEDSPIDFKGQHFELIPFGAGRRICPGLTMGSTAVEFMLANLLHCFDWELPSGMRRDDISVEEEAGLTSHKKAPLYLVPVKYNWQEYTG